MTPEEAKQFVAKSLDYINALPLPHPPVGTRAWQAYSLRADSVAVAIREAQPSTLAVEKRLAALGYPDRIHHYLTSFAPFPGLTLEEIGVQFCGWANSQDWPNLLKIDIQPDGTLGDRWRITWGDGCSTVVFGEHSRAVAIAGRNKQHEQHEHFQPCDNTELAADSLARAASNVVACWESGDLAAAVRQLAAAIKAYDHDKSSLT